MQLQGNLMDVSIKKNLKSFLEERATGKIAFSLGAGAAPLIAEIIFKDGKPVNAQLGPEKGQRALSQILNHPSVGTYTIELEAPPAAAVPSLEEMVTVPPFAQKAAPVTDAPVTDAPVTGAPVGEPEPPMIFDAPLPAEDLPPLESEPASAAAVEPTPTPPPMEVFIPEPGTPAPQAVLTDATPSPVVASHSEALAEILRGLRRRDSNFEAAAIISKDGLMVASILPPGVPQDRVAVSAASIVSQAQSATQDLDRGGFQDFFVRGERGYICVTKAGESAYLLAITKSTAMLGSILLELKKTADEVGKEL